MKYVIDSYASYLESGNVFDSVWKGLNWFFVTVPFCMYRFLAVLFIYIETFFDQSEFFIRKQVEAYNLSKTIFTNFGGYDVSDTKAIGIAFMFGCVSLIYSFYSKNGDFVKKLLHYLAVISVMIIWFGTISYTENGQEKSSNGATFILTTTRNVVNEIRDKTLDASTSFKKSSGSGNLDETGTFKSTVKETFLYVNSGSIDGTMPNGEKLDTSKLLMPSGYEGKEKEKFEKERESYVNGLVDDNEYFSLDGTKITEKCMAIVLGTINLIVTFLPIVYINCMLTTIQIIVDILVVFAPVFMVLSLFPKCQEATFKFLRLIFGVQLMPLIYGVFIGVLFWVNSLIDSAFLAIDASMQKNTIANVLGSGIYVFVAPWFAIVIKVVLMRKIWKNRYRLLNFFLGGGIEVNMPAFEQKFDKALDDFRTKAVSAGEMLAGAYTGNPQLAMEGFNGLYSGDGGIFDKALDYSATRWQNDPAMDGFYQGEVADVPLDEEEVLASLQDETELPADFEEVEDVEDVENTEDMEEELEDASLSDESDELEEVENPEDIEDASVLDEDANEAEIIGVNDNDDTEEIEDASVQDEGLDQVMDMDEINDLLRTIDEENQEIFEERTSENETDGYGIELSESETNDHVIVDNLPDDTESVVGMADMSTDFDESSENKHTIHSFDESVEQSFNQAMDFDMDMDTFFSQEIVVQDFEDQDSLTIGLTDEEEW